MEASISCLENGQLCIVNEAGGERRRTSPVSIHGKFGVRLVHVSRSRGQDERCRGNPHSTKPGSRSGKVDPAALTWLMKVWISGQDQPRGEQEASRPVAMFSSRSWSTGAAAMTELPTTNCGAAERRTEKRFDY